MKLCDGSVGSMITLTRTRYLYTRNTAGVMNGTWVFCSPPSFLSSSFFFCFSSLSDWWCGGGNSFSPPSSIVLNTSSLRSHWHAKSCIGAWVPLWKKPITQATGEVKKKKEKYEDRSSLPQVFKWVRWFCICGGGQKGYRAWDYVWVFLLCAAD